MKGRAFKPCLSSLNYKQLVKNPSLDCACATRIVVIISFVGSVKHLRSAITRGSHSLARPAMDGLFLWHTSSISFNRPVPALITAVTLMTLPGVYANTTILNTVAARRPNVFQCLGYSYGRKSSQAATRQ